MLPIVVSQAWPAVAEVEIELPSGVRVCAASGVGGGVAVVAVAGARADGTLSSTAWGLVRAPADLRVGAERLLSAIGGEAASGVAYVFRNRAGTRVKVVSVEAMACGCVCGGCIADGSRGRVKARRAGR